MAEKRKRSQNFGTEEKDMLVKLLALHRENILNKKTDGPSNEAKSQSWIEVTNSFNSSSTIYRSKESLVKVWEKLKTESKHYYQSMKRNSIVNGSGPSEMKVDPILEQVCTLLRQAGSGILKEEVYDEVENTLDTEEPYSKKKLHDNLCINNGTVYEIEVLNDIIEDTEENVNEPTDPLKESIAPIPKTPLWMNKKPDLSKVNENSDTLPSLYKSYSNFHKKRKDLEDLKKQLLLDEINFKRKLYDLQLQAATKEVEIKAEIFNQLKGGVFNVMQYLSGSLQNNIS